LATARLAMIEVISQGSLIIAMSSCVGTAAITGSS
jgi:hypothetical protein